MQIVPNNLCQRHLISVRERKKDDREIGIKRSNIVRGEAEMIKKRDQKI